MMFLGLDLASKLTGWCAGTGAELPLCGAWEFPECRNEDGSHTYGKVLVALEDYLDAAHGRFRFDAVSYEAPILKPKRWSADGDPIWGDNLHKLRLLYPLSAFLEWWCLRQDIPCFEVTVQAIKKQVTGNHIAPKGDLVAVARKVGLRLPTGDGIEDAADAWGAWMLLLRAYDEALSAEWTARIWDRKGALL